MVTLTGDMPQNDMISITTEVLGMTLRDWFAGMALQGMIASDENMREATEKAIYSNTSPTKYIATMMYEIADAMLEARKK